MKKILFLILLAISITGCKKSQKLDETTITDDSERTAKQSDGLTLLKGEFVYHDGAAILQTHAEIYGVLLTNKFEALNEEAKKYKSEPTDMVQVTIRGKITNEKHEKILWKNKVEVHEILSVKPNPKEENNVIKLGNQ